MENKNISFEMTNTCGSMQTSFVLSVNDNKINLHIDYDVDADNNTVKIHKPLMKDEESTKIFNDSFREEEKAKILYEIFQNFTEFVQSNMESYTIITE